MLGFEAVALAAPGASALGRSARSRRRGSLTAPPTTSLTIPGDPVQAAALGWFHVNCGTACHNGAVRRGQKQRLLHAARRGHAGEVDRPTPTRPAGRRGDRLRHPGAAATYRLQACNVGASSALLPGGHRDGVDGTPYGTQMPPIDTHKVDEAGLAQVAAFINDGCDGG